MQICKYRYEVAYRENIQGKSVKGTIQGHDFILTLERKAIWVRVRRQDKKGNPLKSFLFTFAISQMFAGSVRSIETGGRL